MVLISTLCEEWRQIGNKIMSMISRFLIRLFKVDVIPCMKHTQNHHMKYLICLCIHGMESGVSGTIQTGAIHMIPNALAPSMVIAQVQPSSSLSQWFKQAFLRKREFVPLDINTLTT